VTDAPLRPENDGPLESPEQLASEARSVQPSFVAVQAPFATPERIEMARELVRTIAVAHTNAALYPTTHPLVSTTLGDLVRAVQTLVSSGFASVSLNIYKGTLFVENQVFPEESVTYRRLIEECLDRGVSAITFIEGTTETDAASLIELLAQSRITDIENATRFLEQKGATHVSVAETTTLESGEEQNQEARHRARDSYEAGLNSMRDIEAQAKLGKTMEIGSLQRVVESLLDNLLQDPAAVLALTAIKGHDDYTLNHSLNVCVLALSLGSALGLPAEDLRSLGLAALLYDIGKVRIAEDILAKAGPLTAAEWQEVKRHTEEGADLLKRLQLADKMPMIVAYEHHQRYDMMGYPDAASDSEQHVFSRVVSVCDAYDAMTTNRPFRREIRPDKALAVLMQGRGKAYDPTVTKALVAMLGIYPMGAVVRLDDRSIAVVYRVNNDDLLHPRVKLLIDPSGAWREAPEMLDLRLVDPITGEAVRSIVEAIPAAEAGVDDVWQYL